ncbi:hypothetical protein [Ilumatobacter nonamiensis]|uniref:hypothetical protein n=1 Tax=Ilumatobacter nonamiensis TaxID=467093 RepID=UPI000346B1D7|nr:hypothetical protein [Ilumatobacter nonamiensis]
MTHIHHDAGTDREAPRQARRTRPIPPPPPRRAPPPTVDHTTASDEAEPDRSARLMIRAWIDPLVDETGHDPRSRYVETFWLGVLGPTATWLLRRLVGGLEQHPDGYEIDLCLTAQTMGMSYTTGRSSPFSKALQRCTMFGLAHQTSDGLAVRRRVPAVAYRHLRRMPDAVQSAHDAWTSTTVNLDEFSRAHRLALAMLESGDDSTLIEHHLVALGVGEVVAAQVADNAGQL